MKIILKHMLIAFKVSSNMFYGSLLALIHELIPDLFQNIASNKIKELYDYINKKK
jgi:hypothetical protein